MFSDIVTAPVWSKDSSHKLFWENSESSYCLEKLHRGLGKLIFQPRPTQLVGLAAMVEAFQLFQNETFNLLSDSLYVVAILNCIEHDFSNQLLNKDLFMLLSLLYFVQCRSHCFYVKHLRSHSSLSEPLVKGNAAADALMIW